MFISSKQCASTVGKCQITELRELSLMHEFIFLLIKTCLLFHWFYIFKTKEDPQKELKLRGVFILKLLNDTLAFCSLKNLNFLLPHTVVSANYQPFPYLSLQPSSFCYLFFSTLRITYWHCFTKKQSSFMCC